MNMGLITGCVGVDVRPMTDRGLWEILLSMNATVQARTMPNSLPIMGSISFVAMEPQPATG